MSIILTDQNFEKEILNSQKPILVDFSSAHCFPCLILAPILEALEKEFGERFVLAKIDVNSAPIVSQKYQIDATPTVILFKNGKPFSGFVGSNPKEVIKEWLEKII